MENLSKYEEEGYEGLDASIEISLFEYGFIYKELENGDYLFVIGIDNFTGLYSTFTNFSMSKKEFEELQNESWFNINAVKSYCGISKEENFNFPDDLSSFIRYHGYQNIVGGSDNKYQIICND